MRVLCKVPISKFTGYGNDGLGLITALQNWGCDVRINPTGIDAPLPPNVAAALTLPLQPPFDLVINHVDPYQLCVTDAELRSSTMRIGWTMWERTGLEGPPPNYPKDMGFPKRLKGMDLLLTYDHVSKEAMDKQLEIDQIDLPTTILQGGADFTTWTPSEVRSWGNDDPFRFIMVGQLHQRKDPFVAIQAFRELKEDGLMPYASLTLKTTVPGLHKMLEESTEHLKIHYETWPVEVLKRFYDSSHVLLSPSRGEGKNMPALEFLATGGTVIATAWGGHDMWLDETIGYPLDYTLKPAHPNRDDILEARADKDHLKELMLHCYNNRAECRQKGELASTLIPQKCSWDSVVERLFLKLKESGDVGNQIHRLAVSARAEASIREDEIIRGNAQVFG